MMLSHLTNVSLMQEAAPFGHVPSCGLLQDLTLCHMVTGQLQYISSFDFTQLASVDHCYQICFKHDLPPRYAHHVPRNTASDWKVHFFLHNVPVEYQISCQQPEPVPVSCHTSLNEIEVTFNETTLDFVCEPLPDDESIATSLDAWIHGCVLHMTADYNVV